MTPRRKSPRATILMVDDRVENLVAVEAVLQPLGHKLVRALSGEEALRQVLLHDFAVILLDVQMPGMNGFETAQIIKSRQRSRHTPIIFLTAISKEEEYVFEGYSAGAVDYLFKPFNPDILRSKVSVFVDLYLKEQQLREQGEMLRQSEVRELELLHRTKLVESEARYAQIIDSATDSIIAFGNDRRITVFNAAAERTFGIPVADALGRIVDDFVQLPVDVTARGGSQNSNIQGVSPPAKQSRGSVGKEAEGSGSKQEGDASSKATPSKPEKMLNAASSEIAPTSEKGGDSASSENSLASARRGDAASAERAPKLQKTGKAGSAETTPTSDRKGDAGAAERAPMSGQSDAGSAETAPTSGQSDAGSAERAPASEHKGDAGSAERAPASEPKTDAGSAERASTSGHGDAGSDERAPTSEQTGEAAGAERTDVEGSSGHASAAQALPSQPWNGTGERDPKWIPPAAGTGEAVGTRADGTTFPVEFTTSSLTVEEERFDTLILRDISERRRAEELLQIQKESLENTMEELRALNEELAERTADLEEAMGARSRFYASMSHELRTPINAILGYSALLLDNIYGPLNEKQAASIKRTNMAGSHLLELVNDILDLSKIEAGKLELQYETVQFPTLVQDLFVTVAPYAEKHKVELSLDAPAEPWTTDTDPRKVRQIALNLLSNAIKFGSGKPVRVFCSPLEDGGFKLEVTDQGPGIPAEDQGRIFEEFVQLDQTVSDPGTGLGLPISRSLAELLGGTLSVSSKPGQGSTFTLVVPRSEKAIAARKRERAAAESIAAATPNRSGDSETPEEKPHVPLRAARARRNADA
jgi:signal transduction histidine kinase/CheY-like chemotaxis protein